MDNLVVARAYGRRGGSMRDNRDAAGGMFYSGMTLPAVPCGRHGRPRAARSLDVIDIDDDGGRGRGERDRTARTSRWARRARVEVDAVPGLDPEGARVGGGGPGSGRQSLRARSDSSTSRSS